MQDFRGKPMVFCLFVRPRVPVELGKVQPTLPPPGGGVGRKGSLPVQFFFDEPVSKWEEAAPKTARGSTYIMA